MPNYFSVFFFEGHNLINLRFTNLASFSNFHMLVILITELAIINTT